MRETADQGMEQLLLDSFVRCAVWGSNRIHVLLQRIPLSTVPNEMAPRLRAAQGFGVPGEAA